MAGVQDSRLAIEIAKAGGLGALPCAMWDKARIQAEVEAFRRAVSAPINLNFFCHAMPEEPDYARWLERLKPYFMEYKVEARIDSSGLRRPFDDGSLRLLSQLRPEYVSFHFGLPGRQTIDAIKECGAEILATATSLREAKDLEERGADFIILQGSEAGGHRGMYLETELSSQSKAFDLLAQCLGTIAKPLILAGGIRNAEDVEKAFTAGASAVQVGTALLLSDEVPLAPAHRLALRKGGETELTNLLTGRYARGLRNRLMEDLGGVSGEVPPFPYAASALSGLKKTAEAQGSTAFTALWAGSGINATGEGSAREIFTSLIPRSFK